MGETKRIIYTGRYIPDPDVTKIQNEVVREPEKVIHAFTMKPMKRRNRKLLSSYKNVALLVSVIAPIEFGFMYASVFLMTHSTGWIIWMAASYAWAIIFCYANFREDKKKNRIRPGKQKRFKKRKAS